MRAPSPASTPAESVSELFTEHCDFVARTLGYLGVATNAVDDALQDVFVVAYRRWDSFEGRSSARTWLYGISRRIASRYRRKRDTGARRFVLESHEHQHQPFDRMQARRSVCQLVAALDEAKRAAFILVEVEGLTAPEAAEVLDVPVGTVYSRVRSAWQGLRASADADREAIIGSLPRPPLDPERRDRVARGLMLAGIGKGAVPAAAATVGWTGIGIGMTAAATVLAVALWPRQPEPDTDIDVSAVVTASEPAPGQSQATPGTAQVDLTKPSGTAQVPNPGSDPRLAPGTHAGAPEPAPADRTTDRNADSPRDAAVTQRANTKARANEPSPPAKRTKTPYSSTATAPADSTLPQEVKLIRAGQAAAQAGDQAKARKAFTEHAKKFPNGQLRQEREAALRKLDP